MTTSLKISEKEGMADHLQFKPTIWCKDCENWSSRSWDTVAPSEKVCYDTKIGCHGNVPWGIGKLRRIKKTHANTFHLVKKITKICPADPKIALLMLKEKKKLSQAQKYSHVGKCAERAKKVKVKKRIAVCDTSTAPLRELTCHMGSHSVTCYPAEVTFPPFIPAN